MGDLIGQQEKLERIENSILTITTDDYYKNGGRWLDVDKVVAIVRAEGWMDLVWVDVDKGVTIARAEGWMNLVLAQAITQYNYDLASSQTDRAYDRMSDTTKTNSYDTISNANKRKAMRGAEETKIAVVEAMLFSKTLKENLKYLQELEQDAEKCKNWNMTVDTLKSTRILPDFLEKYLFYMPTKRIIEDRREIVTSAPKTTISNKATNTVRIPKPQPEREREGNGTVLCSKCNNVRYVNLRTITIPQLQKMNQDFASPYGAVGLGYVELKPPFEVLESLDQYHVIIGYPCPECNPTKSGIIDSDFGEQPRGSTGRSSTGRSSTGRSRTVRSR
jgi:hypothetical protein